MSGAVASAARVVRLGFIGLGWIGKRRLDAIAREPCIEVAALADVDAERLRVAHGAYPRAVVAASTESLADQALDGVVIATPNACHAEQTIRCLEAGFAVFCQKPLATSHADTVRVVETASRHDRLLDVDFCYRHIAGVRELRQRIEDGALGRLVSAELVFHNAFGPDKRWANDIRLAGGGCLLDLGVHLVDLLAWLAPRETFDVAGARRFAHGVALASGAHVVEDVAFAELRSRSGAMVRLASSWHAHLGRDAEIEVTLRGTEAGASLRNVDGSFVAFDVAWLTCHRREPLGSIPDAWECRALASWVKRLSVDARFDPRVQSVTATARLIEEMYRS